MHWTKQLILEAMTIGGAFMFGHGLSKGEGTTIVLSVFILLCGMALKWIQDV